MNELLKYRENWEFFIRRGNSVPVFPREISTARTVVYSYDDYINYILRNNGKLSCYTGVYSIYQREMQIIDTVLLEFDATCIKEMLLFAELLEKKMKKFGFKYRKYFSGRRGFHYYLDLERPVKLERARKVLREFINKFFSFPTAFGRVHIIDTKTSGDIARIIRIPYTIHPDTGFFCYRVIDKLRFRDMICPPKIEETIEPNPELGVILRMIEKQVKEEEKPINKIMLRFPKSLRMSIDFAPPCIVNIISELIRTGELSHEKRFHLGAFLKHVGVPIEDAKWLYAYASDFVDWKTEYQLESIYSGPYRTYSCKRAKELNMCPLSIKQMKQCIYYPWISLYFGDGNREVCGFPEEMEKQRKNKSNDGA